MPIETVQKIAPNEMQQKAIDILEGQVMLLAGPGTGKTFTIIHRIENMLIRGIDASSILCLTFSDAAASEMRQRLIKKMGVIASSVNIFTYHSFCNDIIRNNPLQFSLAQGVRLISDSEKISIMKECIDEINLTYFVPTRADKYFFTKNFIDYVKFLKSKRITKEEYLSFIETNPSLLIRIKQLEEEIYKNEQQGKTRNKGRYEEIEKIKINIEKAKELWDIYELYSNKMINHNLIDYADMINFVLDAFEEDFAFLKEVSNNYKYFLVDEYQDTNNLQNNIIFNLLDGNDNKNIFVVGDDDQIIYGFQGANIDSIENFLIRYPDTEVICLKENNRSTQSILDCSYALISQDELRLENNQNFKSKNITKKLTAKNKNILDKEKKVRRYQFGEAVQEMNYIVDEIKNIINSKSCPIDKSDEKLLSEIAIITRKRAELLAYAELLKGKNIPCQIGEGKNIFYIRSSILTYFYMKILCNHYLSSDKLFGLLLSEPFKIDLDDYNKILHEQQVLRGLEHTDFITLMKKLDGWKNPKKINDFLEVFDSLKRHISSHGLRNSVIEIINRTGILEAFFAEPKNKMENILGIKKIIEEATELENNDSTRSLADFVKYLDDCKTNDIAILTEKDALVQNAVQLLTYHGSKGREFEYVYLPNLIAKNWENFSMPGEYKFITEEVLDKETAQAKKDAEALKLLFVGITRAKHALTLSFADLNGRASQQITKYLIPLNDFNFDSRTFEFSKDDFVTEYVRSVSRDVYDNRNAFINEIKERVSNTILSPSSMNNYLRCPRNYFYTKVLKIDIKEGDWDNANFGTLIHSLLEKSVRAAKQSGRYLSIEAVKEDFLRDLNTIKFTSAAKKEKFHKIGLDIIDNYYPHFSALPVDNIENIEFSFYGVEVDGNSITGKIDRVEKNPDGTYSLYDYKTGTPPSPLQVSSDGDKKEYYNQLCFYKYAFEKFTAKKVTQTGLIYVENHPKSIYKTLSDEDMHYIENKIKETCANIKALKFDPVLEDNQGACKNCMYKELCKLDLI